MIELRPYQSAGIDSIAKMYQSGTRRIVRQLATGGGKCHAKGTPILMYDGTIRPIETIVKGDQVMGVDSTPRTVLATGSGSEMMYKVTPIKGDPYIVNESHILSLKVTGSNNAVTIKHKGKYYRSGDIVNISVTDYLNGTNTLRHCLKGWRVAVDFKPSVFGLSHDPYFMGIWLGDGNSKNASITSGDQEVKNWIINYAKENGWDIRIEPNSENSEVYHLIGGGLGRNGSSIINALKTYGLIDNKHIPHEYKTASREDRLKLLAGIIDTDGHYDNKQFSITLKSERLLDDVVFVARSLGFAAYKRPVKKTCVNNGKVGDYFTCHIGGDLERIPTLIPRKKANPRGQKKDVLLTGIKVEQIGISDYYGISIDGDHLYMLGDFTVTHNTVEFSGMTHRYLQAFNKSVLIAVHRDELLKQTRRTLYNGFGIHSEAITAGRAHVPKSPAYVAMVETLYNRLKKRPTWADHVGMLIVDECHIGNFKKLYDYFPKALIVGFSATPIAATKKDPLKNHFDDIVPGVQIADLIDMGSLCQNETYSIKGIDKRKFNVKLGEYDVTQMGKEFSNVRHVQNTVEAYQRLCHGQKTMVFNVNIEHSKLVNQAFLDAGLPSRHLDGMENDAIRQETFAWFKNTPNAILNNIGIATTGFDEPSIINVIVNRSTMSLPLWLQMTGRGARPYPGKPFFRIIDMGGNVLTHGDWRQDRNWSDMFHFPDRPSSGGGVAPIKCCDNCEAIIPASATICSFCGHIHERIINYDTVAPEFEKIVSAMSIENLVEFHTANDHKPFAPFFDLLNKTMTVLKYRTHGINLTDDDCNNSFTIFENKVKEWCKITGRPYSRSLKNFTLEQFTKRFNDLKLQVA